MVGSVDGIYQQVRAMAAAFDFKPEERINESALSKRLGVSRTPLREALNRLAAEGLLTASEGRGFFCRPLVPEQIVQLYELRLAIEAEAAWRAVDRASDEEVAQLGAFLSSIAPDYHSEASAREIVKLDEEFHLRMTALSKNQELVRTLENINERLRYVRWISMRQKMDITHAAHQAIFNRLEARDGLACVAQMRGHIEKSLEEAQANVRAAFSEIYVPGATGKETMQEAPE